MQWSFFIKSAFGYYQMDFFFFGKKITIEKYFNVCYNVNIMGFYANNLKER